MAAQSPKHDPETILAAREMYERGDSLGHIARTLGIGHSTPARWRDKYGWMRSDEADTVAAEAAHLDTANYDWAHERRSEANSAAVTAVAARRAVDHLLANEIFVEDEMDGLRTFTNVYKAFSERADAILATPTADEPEHDRHDPDHPVLGRAVETNADLEDVDPHDVIDFLKRRADADGR